MTKHDYIPEQYRIKSVESLKELFNQGFGVFDRFRAPKVLDYQRPLSGDFNQLAGHMVNKMGGKLSRAQVVEGRGSSLSMLSDVQLNSIDSTLKTMANEIFTDISNFELLLHDKMLMNSKVYLSPTFKDKALCNITPPERGWERYIASYTGASAGHIMKHKAVEGVDNDVVAHLTSDEHQSPVALPKHNLLLVIDYKS